MSAALGFSVFNFGEHNLNFELHLRQPWSLGVVRDPPAHENDVRSTALFLGPLSVTYWRGNWTQPYEAEDTSEPEQDAA